MVRAFKVYAKVPGDNILAPLPVGLLNCILLCSLGLVVYTSGVTSAGIYFFSGEFSIEAN